MNRHRRVSKTARTLMVGAAALVVLGVAAAVGVAVIPGSDGTIQGCYLKGIGTLRVVDKATDCTRVETPITWNQKGPAGPQGLSGATGPRGLQGPAGPQGPVGPAGSTALASLAGGACRTHDGRDGRLAVTVNAADDVVLHCGASSGGGGATPGIARVNDVAPPSDLPPGATNVRGATVHLDAPAQGDTFVSVTSGDPATLIVPSGGVTVPNGQTTADVLVTVVGGGATVTLTFTLGGSTASVTVVTGM